MANILIISDYGVRIRFRDGRFIVEHRDGKQEYNPLNLEQVIIATGGVWLSSKVVRKMIEYGIDLVFLDHKGLPVGRVYPPYINKTVDTRREQYQAYNDERGVHIIREIVSAKIANQAGLLKRYYHSTRISELREAYIVIMKYYEKAKSIDDHIVTNVRDQLRIIEAHAAQVYWSSIALLLPGDIGFESRDHDSEDLFNMSLNYAYGILYSTCWKALVLAGLDPYAGFMHVDRSGKPVLVYDFIEQYRFIADYTLLKMFRRGWRPRLIDGFIEYSSRARIIARINEFMDNNASERYGGRPLTIRQVIKKNAFQLAGFLRGENPYNGFVWDW